MIFRSMFSTRVGAGETAVRGNNRSSPTLSFSSFRSASESKEYRPIRRLASADFLLTILVTLLICGCGDSAVPEAAKDTPEQEFTALQKKAEAGNANAQFNLGVRYGNGQGAPKDAAKAVEWWQRTAAQGDVGAQVNLGVAYAIGEGVPKDTAKALEWWQKAAAQGDAEMQYRLGQKYAYGRDVPKDAAKALEWYQKAATQGYVVAQYELGSMYAKGKDVPKDAAKAVEWYQKAAAQGHVEAQYHLGSMHANGEGVPKDAAKAVEWYQKAAAQGHDWAQLNLVLKYADGDGTAKDTVLAYAWLKLSEITGGYSDVKRPMIQVLLSRNHLNEILSLSGNDLAEAQRLSSRWKKGQILVREGKSATASSGTPAVPEALRKKEVGTIFVVSKTGHAITNHHITRGCTELRIQGRDGVAKVVTEDLVNDLSLVQIPGALKDTAAITAEPGKLRQGEDIVVFGFPLNAVLSSGGNLTPGVVSALTGLGNNTNQIQITAPIQPGSSGSPVMNKKGEVVGVVSMKLSDSKMAKATGSIGQNVNFAVSGQTLKTFLDTHKVEYRTGGLLSFDKNTADVADEARKWTLVIECWR